MSIEVRVVEGADTNRMPADVAKELVSIDQEVQQRTGRIIHERRLMQTVLGGAHVETLYISIDFPEPTEASVSESYSGKQELPSSDTIGALNDPEEEHFNSVC